MQRTLVVWLALASWLASPPACAQDPGVELHPTVGAGFAFPLVGYEGHSFGPDVRAGVDLVWSTERSHRLALDLGWTGLGVAGMRIDVIPVQAGWRWVPAPDVGFYTIVAAGLGPAIETLDAQLGPRDLVRVAVRLALQASIGIGITLFEHVDLEIVYRQAWIAGSGEDALGTIGARLGGRL